VRFDGKFKIISDWQIFLRPGEHIKNFESSLHHFKLAYFSLNSLHKSIFRDAKNIPPFHQERALVGLFWIHKSKNAKNRWKSSWDEITADSNLLRFLQNAHTTDSFSILAKLAGFIEGLRLQNQLYFIGDFNGESRFPSKCEKSRGMGDFLPTMIKEQLHAIE